MKKAIKHFQEKLAFEIDSADLFSALESKENIVVIDTRKNFAYLKEHIPGAISLSHRDMNAATTSGFDRSVLYVTYCDGIGCNASTKGALNMARLGFNVRELLGGIEWWKFDGHETEGSHEAASVGIQCSC